MNGFYSSLKGALNRRVAYNRTLTELERLSSHELRDLGFTPYDLPRIARESVYGK